MKILIAFQVIFTIIALVSFLAGYLNSEEPVKPMNKEILFAEVIYGLSGAAIACFVLIVLTTFIMTFSPAFAAITISSLVPIVVCHALLSIALFVRRIDFDFAVTVIVFLIGYLLAVVALATGYARKMALEKKWVFSSIGGQAIAILAPVLLWLFVIKF